MSNELIEVHIDGTPFKATKGAMVIEVADQSGIHIPRFCYHKKLSIAANCRMCLVEVEKAPKPLPACATPVMDGMKVFTKSPLALRAQKAVMEFLLINHPLDCPICDQGGECELQDIAMGFGRGVSRFHERKRVVADKNIGPLIRTDMTRCIHCTRCVRVGDEIAGMRELGATGRGEHMEIGTFIAKSVDSEMSGNVIDVCPVGALTSKPFRYRARAWEMTQRQTIAPHDAIGSNLHVHIKRDRVMRVVPMENEDINEVWISDRDRYSYQGLYSSDRLLSPMIKHDDDWKTVDWETALDFATRGLTDVVAKHGAERLGVLASPSATIEEHYLLQKLGRGIGTQNLDHRLRQSDFSDQDQAPLCPTLGQSLADLERIDAALLIGSNCRKEQPICNHRLRKAARTGANVMVLNPIDYDFNYDTREKIIASPVRMITALAGIARALQPAHKGDVDNAPDGLLSDVNPGPIEAAIAERLKSAERATVLLGSAALAHPKASVLRSLADEVARHSRATLGVLSDGSNSAGAWLSGMLPHREAGGTKVASPGLDAGAMLARNLPAYLLLGVEPEFDCHDSNAAQRAVTNAEFVVHLTAYRTQSMSDCADVLLPIAAFAENSGTYVNLEGKWQSFLASVHPVGEARPAWKVLRVMGNLLNQAGFEYLDSNAVLTELKSRVDDSSPSNPVAPPRAPLRSELNGEELYRHGDVPIYAVDPLVRRAQALQKTADAVDAAIRVNGELAQQLGLSDGDMALAKQHGDEGVRLPVVVDNRISDDCVYVHAGVPASVGLGPSIGPIRVEKI